MQNKLERLIKAVYKDWKSAQPQAPGPHPQEEAFVCFLEGKLSAEENEAIQAHLISCERCAQILSIRAKAEVLETKDVPQELLGQVRKMLQVQDKPSILEIALRLTEKVLEIINTTGDVLVGQELMPAPILRSRKIKDFKDEVIILKDFKDIRVEAKIENKAAKAFTLTVLVKEKESQKIVKDLRVTLLKDNLELESYLNDAGAVIFENVLLGQYRVEIAAQDDKLASILLDIKT
jgi:pseudouridine-5'-phosphate glycosidase